MVADWHDGFVLRSEWLPGDEPQTGRYRLTLTNRTKAAISGFRLGISGPARISEAAKPANAMVVTQLSNYAELAAPAGFSLAPGADWTVEIDRLDYPLRHWTDGATTGFVIFSDGKSVPTVTFPTGRASCSETSRESSLMLSTSGSMRLRSSV